MDHLIECVRKAVRDKNWYAALGMALTLPDICVTLEFPVEGSNRTRYATWFDANFRLSSQYDDLANREEIKFAELMARGQPDRAFMSAMRRDEFRAQAAQARAIPPGDPAGKTYLSGSDCYALRCAFLHKGEMETTGQRAQDVLEKYIFTEPRRASIHMGFVNKKILVVTVDYFCEDVCRSAEDWLARVSDSTGLRARASALPRIVRASEPLILQ